MRKTLKKFLFVLVLSAGLCQSGCSNGPDKAASTDLAYQYLSKMVPGIEAKDIYIAKIKENSGDTIVVVQAGNMICEMPVLKGKDGWMATGISCNGQFKPAEKEVAQQSASTPAVDKEKAQQKINQLLAIVSKDRNNRDAWVALGNEYFDSDQPVESINAYEKALAINQNDANVLTDLGVMYRRMGQFDRAIECFQAACKVNPTQATAMYNLGITYRYDIQDFNKAREAWKKFLAISPNGPGSDRVRQELNSL